MELLPLYICKEGVVGIGEIGFDDQTKAEEKYLRWQAQLALEADLPIQIHTPHRDKKAGTIRTMDVLEDLGVDPGKVIIDHNNEETVKAVLDRGYWAAFTIYPHTKLGNQRMVEVMMEYGAERIVVDSAADWGISDPLAVPKTAALMKDRGITLEQIEQVTYFNPLAAYGQSGQVSEEDWAGSAGIDPTALFEGNTLLRGGMDVETAMSQYLIE
jgi:predicted metal-dependent TIM-barrel fold hydrolase